MWYEDELGSLPPPLDVHEALNTLEMTVFLPSFSQTWSKTYLLHTHLWGPILPHTPPPTWPLCLPPFLQPHHPLDSPHRLG